MLFNSLDFLLFSIVVLIIQRLLPHRPRNIFLLAASYFFYGSWDWRFLSLILFSTILDFYCGRGISASQTSQKRKWLLAASVTANLLVLGFFKYADFFIESASELIAFIGLNPASFRLDIVLPVGISFYTFQTMSYTIDIYRKQTEPVKHFIDFALFVSFFPQLVAGPIERAKHLAPQMTRKPVVTLEMFRVGCWLIMWGLFKKVVIADNMAVIVDDGFSTYATISALEVWLCLYAFAFQIYADFSGYTDIARGIAKLLGYDLMLNFKLPYFAVNPSDFWRRWHVSLSTWLRDYLYIPLGGNRNGKGRLYVNLMLTMLLGGLWHGASWMFLIWGAFHGALLVGHKLLREKEWMPEPETDHGRKLWWLLRVVCMFHLTCIGWLIFRAQSVGQFSTMLSTLFGNYVLTEQAMRWGWGIVVVCLPLWLIQVLQGASGDTNAVLKLSLPSRTLVYAGLAGMIICLGSFGAREFIYFQF